MLLKWIPWKYFLKRTARTYGVIDPLTLLAHLRRFAQPSEVQEPIELIREGIKFHARGLINTKVIQQNLDWIWPYWVEKQYNPNDPSFIPRAFSFSHINLTHRNWTALGLPNFSAYPIIDPRGLVTPLYNGWSLDFWIVSQNGRHLIPSKLSKVEQHLETEDLLRLTTACQSADMRLFQSAEVFSTETAPELLISLQAQASVSAWLVLALRPYNPEGVQFIEQIKLDRSRKILFIDARDRIYLEETPHKVIFSTYADGDVIYKLEEEEKGSSVRCRVGMATAAIIYKLKAFHEKQLSFRIPLPAQGTSSTGPIPHVESWQATTKDTARLIVPDKHIQYLYDTAVRTLILLSAEDIVPGPYTYRRFWFRDACFMLNALLAVGHIQRSRRILASFPQRQKRSGYFHSQDGEWDSNGQVLWIYNRYEKLSGEKILDPSTRGSIDRAVKWIQRKRLPKNKSAHAGLLPAGFSAEHLGPNDYYYWDNFWALAGLKAAAQMLRRSGSQNRSKEIEGFAEDFKKSVFDSIEKIPEKRSRGGIPASPYRRMDAGAIGSMVADYPLQLMPLGDPRIAATLSFLLENCFQSGAFFQDMIHSGLNVYLTLAIAQSLLRIGNDRYRSLIHTVAALASSSGQWPEAIHPLTGGGCMGDGQHGWAAAEWVMMIRNLFVREEGNCLILCSGIFPEWLQAEIPVRFGPTPTPFGKISIKIRQRGRKPEVWLDADHERIAAAQGYINLPGYRSVKVDDWKGVYQLTPAKL